MRLDEYRSYDALGLAQLVATGQVTAGELLELAQQQATAVNPAINAVVRFMSDQAQSRLSEDLVGPFAGVPFLIKDLAQDYAGLPSCQGSRSLAKVSVTEHSTVVQRWLDAGVLIFGKTNTPEFGAKGITEPELFGPTRNPWDLDRTPGGSSGGSAAAVAAGIVPVAGANDGGGSIRIPAGCCGLVGLKPGRGLISMGPAASESMHGAAAQGVVSRSVRDTAAMLDVLKGAEPSSPFLPAIPGETFLSQVGADAGHLRIGMYLSTVINPDPHPQAQAAVDAAATALTDLGHSVEMLDKPPYDDAALAKDFLLTWFAYLAWEVDDAKRQSGCGDEGFERDTLLCAALGRATSSVAYIDAVQRRHDYVRQLATYFSSYDLLLTPTLADLPPRIGQFDLPRPLQVASDVLLKTRTARLLRHTSVVNQMINDHLGWVPYTQLANLTGRPALSLPLYWTPDGVPMGVHFTAQLGGEPMLIRLAAQLEEALPWASRHSPCAEGRGRSAAQL